jgi:hypothetical protein
VGLQEETDEAINRLDEAVRLERNADDPERELRLIYLGFILNEAKKMISTIQKEAYDLLLDSDWDRSPMENKQFSLETKTGQPRKKWDHKGLAALVASRINDRSIDMETGELLKTPQEQIIELLEYASASYWRVGALKELGIDVDAYCEVLDPLTNLIYRSKEHD